MKTLDIYIQTLIALFTFFWLFIFVSIFPYPSNIILFGIITLILLIIDVWREVK